MAWARMLRVGGALALSLTTLAACDPPPPPVGVVVDSTADAPDAAPGDGACATSTGACTLRAAFDEASASRIDRIEVPSGTYTAATPLSVDPVAPVLNLVPPAGEAAAHVQRFGGTLTVSGGVVRSDRVDLSGPTVDVAAGAILGAVDAVVSVGALRVDGRFLALRSFVYGLQVRSGGDAVIRQSAVEEFAVATGGTASLGASTVLGASQVDGDLDLEFVTASAFDGTGLFVGSGTVTARASMISTVDDMACSGAKFVSEGWNSVDASCPRVGTDRVGSWSDVGDRADARVPVRPLAATSPLRSQIPLGSGPCAADTVDQLGDVRAGDGACDIGAYEYVPGTLDLLVDTAADGVDVAPGDRDCLAAVGGCTLRAAFTEAGRAKAEVDVAVTIAPGIDPVLLPALGPVGPAQGTVVGNGAVIDAAGADGVVTFCRDLRLEDLTVTGAVTELGDVRGAITSACDHPGALVLDGVSVIDNDADGVVSVVDHTDFQVDSTVEIVDSTISGNREVGVVGVVGEIVVRRSTVSGNGQGIIGVEYSGSVLVEDSVVSANRSGVGADEVVPVTIRRSVIADNTSVGVSPGWGTTGVIESSLITGNGRGVWVDSPTGVVVRDSTFSGNDVAVQMSQPWEVDLVRSTIVGEVAFDGGGDAAEVTLHGTVIDTTQPVCGAPGLTVTSLGWNLIADASCSLAGAGDVQGVDPLLGPLADHGGSTATHLPGVGSPAIDAVPSGTAGLCTGALTDQRGVSRPQGAACDRGSVEQ